MCRPSSVTQGSGPRRGPKGSGLGLVIEILGGALAGGDVLEKATHRNWGNLVVALDPAALGHGDQFQKRVQQLLQKLRGSSRADPQQPVQAPGDRGAALLGTTSFPPL